MSTSEAGGPPPNGKGPHVKGDRHMLVLVIVLLVLWLILTVVGFAIDGLVWLGIIGIILLVGTAAIGVVRRKALRR